MTKSLYSNIKKTKTNIDDYLQDVFVNKKVVLFIAFYTLLTYSFNLFNRTISIDDLSRDYYIGDGKAMIMGFRWAMFYWTRIFSTIEFSPFIDKFIALIFLLLSLILLSSLLYMLTRNNNIWLYIAFSGAYVTYSLNNEIWEYSGTAIAIYGGISIAIFVIIYLTCNQKLDVIDYSFLSFLLAIVASGYETSMFAYVTIVAFTLLIRCIYCNEEDWVKDILKYIIPLFFATILKYAIGYLLIKLHNLNYFSNGDVQIYWFSKSILECLKKIIVEGFQYYVVNGLVYEPIFVFGIYTFIYIILIVKTCKTSKSRILGVLAFLSVFLLSFIRGGKMKYRFAQTVQIYISFVSYMMLTFINKKKIYKVLLILTLLISFREGIYYHQILALNNQRSDNEMNVIRTIGNKLYSEHDLNKKVVFVGEYQISNNIKNQIVNNNNTINEKIANFLCEIMHVDYCYKYVTTNVNSVINWSKNIFESQEKMKLLFSYCGYDINVIDENLSKTITSFEQIAIEKDMKALEILEFDDYILVFLGKTTK